MSRGKAVTNGPSVKTDNDATRNECTLRLWRSTEALDAKLWTCRCKLLVHHQCLNIKASPNIPVHDSESMPACYSWAILSSYIARPFFNAFLFCLGFLFMGSFYSSFWFNWRLKENLTIWTDGEKNNIYMILFGMAFRCFHPYRYGAVAILHVSIKHQ